MAMFLTYCFAAIGAINVVFEIFQKVRVLLESARGKIIIESWAEPSTLGTKGNVDLFWRATNDGRKVITIRIVVLQLRGLEGIYCDWPWGDKARGVGTWRKISQDHEAAIHPCPTNLKDYCKGMGGGSATLREGDQMHRRCKLTALTELARKTNLKAPLKCRAVFVTNTKRTYRSRWVEIASLDPPPFERQEALPVTGPTE